MFLVQDISEIHVSNEALEYRLLGLINNRTSRLTKCLFLKILRSRLQNTELLFAILVATIVSVNLLDSLWLLFALLCQRIAIHEIFKHLLLPGSSVGVDGFLFDLSFFFGVFLLLF